MAGFKTSIMKTRTFLLHGWEVEVWRFGNKSFYYPAFNGDAEFTVDSKGFRELSSYLRMMNWVNKIMERNDLALITFNHYG
jgi:hypothetical protein